MFIEYFWVTGDILFSRNKIVNQADTFSISMELIGEGR